MALARRKGQPFTYADYRTWDDDTRWELIDGAAVAMSPAPSPDHQRVVTRLVSQIQQKLADVSEGRCEPFVAPVDVLLPEPGQSADEATTVVQPDVVVVCDPKKIGRRGIIGAPDWVIEVLSPSTAVRDQGEKRALYERHGVREYWLVHPADRSVGVYRLLDGRYGPPEVTATEGTITPGLFPSLDIDWGEVFARVEDPDVDSSEDSPEAPAEPN